MAPPALGWEEVLPGLLPLPAAASWNVCPSCWRLLRAREPQGWEGWDCLSPHAGQGGRRGHKMTLVYPKSLHVGNRNLLEICSLLCKETKKSGTLGSWIEVGESCILGGSAAGMPDQWRGGGGRGTRQWASLPSPDIRVPQDRPGRPSCAPPARVASPRAS